MNDVGSGNHREKDIMMDGHHSVPVCLSFRRRRPAHSQYITMSGIGVFVNIQTIDHADFFWRSRQAMAMTRMNMMPCKTPRQVIIRKPLSRLDSMLPLQKKIRLPKRNASARIGEVGQECCVSSISVKDGIFLQRRLEAWSPFATTHGRSPPPSLPAHRKQGWFYSPTRAT